MKKQKLVKSAAADAGEYRIGQVCGSLFPDQLKPGALSALFSSTTAADTLVFVPAPEPEPKAAAPSGSGVRSPGPAQRKSVKALSAAERKLQDRESALQNADDDGQTSVRRVKRQRPDEPAGDEPHDRRRKTRKNSAQERIRMKRTVFVGNLPASCTKKAILALFKPAGNIESVRFRSVVREDPSMSRRLAAIQRKVHPKKQNINAYIVFREEEAASAALGWNGQEIQTGFHIRVDRVSQHTGHDHKRSIFVGNLPYDASELPLREHFQECGPVEAVRLVRDRDSGMGKGFGYVLFQSPDSVMLALKLNGSTLLERKIRVKRSVKKEKEKKPVPGRPSEGKASPGRERRRAGGLKAPKQEFRGQTQAASFKGETADPAAKRGKGLKKKLKHKKKKPAVHI